MFLVQHDQTEMRRRGEDCTASADDDLDFAASDSSPMFVTLDVAQMAVQYGHTIESAAEAPDRLWRKADFGHEQNRLATEADDVFDRLNVDLGFAAAGDAVDDDRLMLLGGERAADCAQCLNLVGV